MKDSNGYRLSLLTQTEHAKRVLVYINFLVIMLSVYKQSPPPNYIMSALI